MVTVLLDEFRVPYTSIVLISMTGAWDARGQELSREDYVLVRAFLRSGFHQLLNGCTTAHAPLARLDVRRTTPQESGQPRNACSNAPTG